MSEQVARQDYGAGHAMAQAREDLRSFAQAIEHLAQRVDHRFGEAVQLILDRPGKVIVCGLGKSGHVGRKAAATLSSTGTPAVFLHATEAFHGDLGIANEGDTAILISHSGQTVEVTNAARCLRDMGVALIGISGRQQSTLAQMVDVHLETAIERECCPLGLAPTTSTTVTIALLDTLAMALMRARGFRAEDFARRHPGGSLGQMLRRGQPTDGVRLMPATR